MKIFFFCALTIAIGLYFFKSDTADFYANDVSPQCDVVMFSTDWCPVCKRARQYFEKENYPFCEMDIEKDAVAANYYNKLNTYGVPTILIGNKVSVGFKPRQIDEFISEFGIK